MLTFSYLLSPTTNVELEKIKQTRNSLLLELISPQIETTMRFENLVKVIIENLFLSGKSASPREVVNILKSLKTEGPLTQDVLGIKNALDYIRESYLMQQATVSDMDLIRLIKFLDPRKKINTEKVEQITSFINSNPEHPIVQSALSFVLISDLLSQDNDSIKIASNVSNVFAYNHGYDFRGLLNREEYFVRDLANLKEKLNTGIREKNLSSFIEYYVQVFSLAAEAALHKIQESRKGTIRPVDLTRREMKIVTLFDIPDVRVTNRDVQKEFGVSQITASRDLAKLNTLGLIIRKGLGRSVYYVRG